MHFLIGLVDTLEYLKKGGRISKTAAFAGGLLNIHPVLTLTDGEVTIIGKARGSRQGNNLLVQKIHESGGIDFSMPLLLGYSGLSDALLQKYVADSAPLWENGTEALESVCIGSVIGTHAGPGINGGFLPAGRKIIESPALPLGRVGLCFNSQNKNPGGEAATPLRLDFSYSPLGGPLHHMTGDAGGEPPQGVEQSIIHRPPPVPVSTVVRRRCTRA